MRFSRLADWLSWQETLHPSTIDLGLERLSRTLAKLGWQRPPCPVVTVGGTNGKGSCVALLSHILSAAGYRVGTFTSPHLLRYNERIVIAGREISDASLMAAFERIDVARGTDTLTFFEFNALAALLVFETAGLDAVILEVGLGGRLDAVNVVDADVALITSIALDHCEWLGNDVESIGREKAGIMRAGRPAVFGSVAMPNSIAEVARALDARLLRQGSDFRYVRVGDLWSWQGTAMRLENLPAPALVGAVQYDNAAAVLAVLECLSDQLPVDRSAIVRGLRQVSVSGRFQIFGADIEWILDVAHNPAAARVLASQLADRAHSGRTVAVCGILGDKDIEGVVAELRTSFDEWIVVRPASERAIDEKVLGRRLRDSGANVTATAATVAAGCESANSIAQRGDRVVVFGSFFTVAPALEWLKSMEVNGER